MHAVDEVDGRNAKHRSTDDIYVAMKLASKRIRITGALELRKKNSEESVQALPNVETQEVRSYIRAEWRPRLGPCDGKIPKNGGAGKNY